MRVLFLGMDGAFSRAPLAALLAAGRPPAAVVLPAPRDAPFALRRLRPPAGGLIPLTGADSHASLVDLAHAHGLPLLELARPREALAGLAELAPDVACVACWPRRIPPALLSLPAHGFINLHPSLLPAYRGPEPLFWTLRDGARAGVTLHRMDAEFDTGPIAAQAAVDLPDGVSIDEAELRCAEVGGRLLVDMLARLERGALALHPQPPGARSYGTPGPGDFALDAAWSARRAFNFVRGAAAWGQPFTLAAGGELLRLADARSFHPDARLGAPFTRAGGALHMQFSPGVLVAVEYR
jgi:methionyl-tRNA formyltransferase